MREVCVFLINSDGRETASPKKVGGRVGADGRCKYTGQWTKGKSDPPCWYWYYYRIYHVSPVMEPEALTRSKQKYHGHTYPGHTKVTWAAQARVICRHVLYVFSGCAKLLSDDRLD